MTCQASEYLDEYDFIIVGSGPGGCVLANRLTEIKKWNVLVIEAGKVETFMQNVPLLAINNQNTQFDWVFKAEPQDGACLGLLNGLSIELRYF
jgi:choline dehydrogenase-like flavoprotein